MVHLKNPAGEGKNMRESVSGNIKSGGQREDSAGGQGMLVCPQESTNQPTMELWKTRSQNTYVLRFELAELGKRAGTLHGVTLLEMVLLLRVQ
jgi:hypothetical protein